MRTATMSTETERATDSSSFPVEIMTRRDFLATLRIAIFTMANQTKLLMLCGGSSLVHRQPTRSIAKKWITPRDLESAEASNDFPVNDFNGIGGGTISGEFGFLIDTYTTCDNSVVASGYRSETAHDSDEYPEEDSEEDSN